MRKLSVLLAIAVMMTAVMAQNRTGITGIVTDAVTLEPIAGATVMAPFGGAAQTNREGRYFIPIFRPGDYLVGAHARGYEPAFYPDTIRVEQGQVVENINFALRPFQQEEPGAITGKVTNAETGEPLAEAHVMAFGMMRAHAATDENGEYAIRPLAPGIYLVTANLRGFQPAEPETVRVVTGEVTENINFALVPMEETRMGFISGAVTDAETGELIRGAMVRAENEELGRTVTQGRHGYRIKLPPGRYHVMARAPGYEPGFYADSVDVVAGQATEDINFTLRREVPGEPGGIAGTVTDAETGAPLPGAHVIAFGPGRSYANTDEMGNYLIEPLAPGRYLVMAKMRGYLPVEPETVLVTAGETVENINFALTPRVFEIGHISGIIYDIETEEPIAHAIVMARGPSGHRAVRTDEEGRYLMPVRPGEYLVRAAARRYLPAVYPERVAVAANDTVFNINIALQHVPQQRAGIGGWVFDGENQEEQAGVLVTAIGASQTYQTTTDAWGEYLFTYLEPGDYRIEVSRNGNVELYPKLVTLGQDESDSYVMPALNALTGIEDRPGPETFRRLEVHPTILSRSAVIRYQVPTSGHVSLRVTDRTGRVVATLQDGILGAGNHQANWNGTDNNGRRLAGGVYFYLLEAPGIRTLEKTVLTGQGRKLRSD